MSSGRGDKRPKQTAGMLVVACHLFRVILNGHNKSAGIGALCGLDDSVRGPGDGSDSRRNAIQRLVMEGVHVERGGSHDLRQSGILGNRDGVSGDVSRLLLSVRDGRRPLRGDILHERAAHGHVKRLDAAADGKDGHSYSQRFPNECELGRVSKRIYLDCGMLLGCAVMPRFHIEAARKQKAPHLNYQTRFLQIRRDNRASAGLRYGCRIGAIEPILPGTICGLLT